MDAALDEHRLQSGGYLNAALTWMLALCLVGAALGWLLGMWVARNVAANLDAVISVTDAIAAGKLDTPVTVESGDETGRLAASVKDAAPIDRGVAGRQGPRLDQNGNRADQ